MKDLPNSKRNFSNGSKNKMILKKATILFKVRSANTWLKKPATHEVPKMLFDKFWYEGELCIIFADSNLGKSILAVQIANSINNGCAIGPLIWKLTGNRYCTTTLS
jgi:RecA-family ATPase